MMQDTPDLMPGVLSRSIEASFAGHVPPGARGLAFPSFMRAVEDVAALRYPNESRGVAYALFLAKHLFCIARPSLSQRMNDVSAVPRSPGGSPRASSAASGGSGGGGSGGGSGGGARPVAPSDTLSPLGFSRRNAYPGLSDNPGFSHHFDLDAHLSPPPAASTIVAEAAVAAAAKATAAAALARGEVEGAAAAEREAAEIAAAVGRAQQEEAAAAERARQEEAAAARAAEKKAEAEAAAAAAAAAAAVATAAAVERARREEAARAEKAAEERAAAEAAAAAAAAAAVVTAAAGEKSPRRRRRVGAARNMVNALFWATYLLAVLLAVLLLSPAARALYDARAPSAAKWLLNVARQPGGQEDCVTLAGYTTGVCLVQRTTAPPPPPPPATPAPTPILVDKLFEL
jgi:hypothetical protein